MESENYLKDISEIKNLMNKSSQFISLSGLSGAFAGIYAIIGAAYFYITTRSIKISDFETKDIDKATIIFILFVILSTLTTIIFTSIRAKSLDEKSWDVKTKNLVQAFFTPILIGLVFVLILYFNNEYNYLLALLLVFYGIGLLNAGFTTNNLVKPLGYIQVTFGLICAIKYDYTFWFFAIGFGIVHLVYGSIVYFKIDKK